VRNLARTLASERGQALIEGLLALGLVLLVVAVGAQALAYAQARSVATAARRASSSASSKSACVFVGCVSAAISVSAPSVRPRALSGTQIIERRPSWSTIRRSSSSSPSASSMISSGISGRNSG